MMGVLCCCAALSSHAQTQERRIPLTPIVIDGLNIPDDAAAALNRKLMQMTVQNGFGSLSGDFVLTADVVTVDKQVTATAPAQYVVDLEVSVYAVNVLEKIIVAETSFRVKAIDRPENKAVVKAINQLNPRTPAVRTFMNSVREKIVDYYADRLPVLLAKAQSLGDRGEYEEALAVLAAVPDCVEEYPLVAEKMTGLYVQMLDKYARISLREAKSQLALKNYEGAMEALLYVDPMSTLSPEADRMVASISSTIDEAERAERARQIEEYERRMEQAQRMHDDEVMLRKMQIEASQKVGVAAAESGASKRESSLSDELGSWLLGKLNK